MLRHWRLFALSMNDPIIPSKSTGYPCQSIHRNLETSLGMEFPLRSLSHDGSMVLLYIVCHGSHTCYQYTLFMLAFSYQHHGSVMGMRSSWNDHEISMNSHHLRYAQALSLHTGSLAKSLRDLAGRWKDNFGARWSFFFWWYFSRICGTLW